MSMCTVMIANMLRHFVRDVMRGLRGKRIFGVGLKPDSVEVFDSCEFGRKLWGKKFTDRRWSMQCPWAEANVRAVEP